MRPQLVDEHILSQFQKPTPPPLLENPVPIQQQHSSERISKKTSWKWKHVWGNLIAFILISGFFAWLFWMRKNIQQELLNQIPEPILDTSPIDNTTSFHTWDASVSRNSMPFESFQLFQTV